MTASGVDPLWQAMLAVDRAIGHVFGLSEVNAELQRAFDECTAAVDNLRDVLTKTGHSPP